jgi:hypothetical protein
MDGGRRSRRGRGRHWPLDWVWTLRKLGDQPIHLQGTHPIRQIVRFRINPVLEQNGAWILGKSAAQRRIVPSMCKEVR